MPMLYSQRRRSANSSLLVIVDAHTCSHARDNRSTAKRSSRRGGPATAPDRSGHCCPGRCVLHVEWHVTGGLVKFTAAIGRFLGPELPGKRGKMRIRGRVWVVRGQHLTSRYGGQYTRPGIKGRLGLEQEPSEGCSPTVFGFSSPIVFGLRTQKKM